MEKAMASHALIMATTAAAMVSFCHGGLPGIPAEVMKSLKAQGTVTVILALLEPHSDKIMTWTPELSFPIQVWTHFGSQEVERLKNYTMSDTKVIVLVPVSTKHEKKVILELLMSDIIHLSLVRLLFVLEVGDVLPLGDYPDISCALISLNGTVADVPRTNFWNCTERSTLAVDKLFVEDRQRLWTALRHKTFVGSTQVKSPSGAIIANGYTLHSSLAVIRSLRSLNVSIREHVSIARGSNQIIRDILEKKSDIILLAGVISLGRSLYVHVAGYVGEGKIDFYSTGGRRAKVFLNLTLFLHYIAPVALVSACLIISIYFVTSRWLMQPTKTSRFAMFLFASFAGNSSPLPTHSVNLAISRLFCASWLVGMLFLTIYVQSEVTSVASVPSFKRAIETIEDVDRLSKAGNIYPCVVEHRFIHSTILASRNGTLGTLKQLLDDCGESCLSDGSCEVCMKGAKRGTHVFLLLTPSVGRLPCRYRTMGILSGKDHFGIILIGFFLSKAFPYISEYESLLRAIFESGLYIATNSELERKDPTSFVTYEEDQVPSLLPGCMLLYGLGCAAGCLVLLAECLFRKISIM